MSGRHPIGSLVLILALTFVGAVKELNSIKDLKKITSGDSVPRHSLVLLYWFANTIEIDNNGVILLTFEPNNGDYGTHHYGNYEGLLDPLPRRGVPHRYYTLGNLNQMDNQNSAYAFPAYVTQNLHNWMEYEERNRARIIFRVSGNTGRQAGQRIDQVYITQHFESNLGQGTRYDPAHTYSITTDLLREIREFTVRENQRNSLPQLRARFGRNIDDSHT
ncbi:uncharacterized protein LOC130119886 [Lampris incognitus]|uniref:uncharacterized protein LOC130119886 n=1 Tax=Lampris incognitus TaxID=2546036 RepID=UPI0024B60C85|nr:uncharacterized protein LOC130119886 [Lampris incognitus]